MPASDTHVLRIVDAALNRAAEGLRVVEDYLRMVLEDAHLARQAKQLRHDLATASSVIPSAQRHAARDTPGDVGTEITVAQEQRRGDATEVALASFKRSEQALRSVEEYGKLLCPTLAAECEALRYRLYTLEKGSDLTRTSRQRLADARLYVLIDGGATADQFRAHVEQLLPLGVDLLQLRDKRLDDRDLLARAKLLRELTRNRSTLAIMNDRADIAAAADLDGVHLGQEDLPVAAARQIVGTERLIGVSTHAIEQARQAVLDGANYLGAGPTFPSTTKQFDHFPGLEYLGEVAAEISLPAFAIGGITSVNVSEVLATGVTRVAIAAVCDPEEKTSERVKQVALAISAFSTSVIRSSQP